VDYLRIMLQNGIFTLVSPLHPLNMSSVVLSVDHTFIS